LTIAVIFQFEYTPILSLGFGSVTKNF
jgi:hypothetical protein